MPERYIEAGLVLSPLPRSCNPFHLFFYLQNTFTAPFEHRSHLSIMRTHVQFLFGIVASSFISIACAAPAAHVLVGNINAINETLTYANGEAAGLRPGSVFLDMASLIATLCGSKCYSNNRTAKTHGRLPRGRDWREQRRRGSAAKYCGAGWCEESEVCRLAGPQGLAAARHSEG